MIRGKIVSAAVATLLASPTVRAREPTFGDRGTLAISASTSLDMSSFQYPAADGDTTSEQRVYISLQGNIFPTRLVSLGFTAYFQRDSYAHLTKWDGTKYVPFDETTTASGAGPQVGVLVPLSNELLFFWPRAWLRYSVADDDLPNGKVHWQASTLGVECPVVLQAATHFFLALGPYWWSDVSRRTDSDAPSGLRSRYGISGEIGVWL